MIRISHADEETLRARFTELRAALDDIIKYMGRKTAKVMSLTMDIEKTLDLRNGEAEKKAPDKG